MGWGLGGKGRFLRKFFVSPIDSYTNLIGITSSFIK
jgi:hypothetical protein